MEPQKVNNFETRLRQERTQLLERIHQQLHRSDDPELCALVDQLSQEDGWAAADLQGDIDIAMLGQEFSGLRDIDEALKRIAKGDYGICKDCGQPIDPKRLNAQPAARVCLACKEAFEKRRGIVSQRTL
jgi:RNA polymerase-binding protein DksA